MGRVCTPASFLPNHCGVRVAKAYGRYSGLDHQTELAPGKNERMFMIPDKVVTSPPPLLLVFRFRPRSRMACLHPDGQGAGQQGPVPQQPSGQGGPPSGVGHGHPPWRLCLRVDASSDTETAGPTPPRDTIIRRNPPHVRSVHLCPPHHKLAHTYSHINDINTVVQTPTHNYSTTPSKLASNSDLALGGNR